MNEFYATVNPRRVRSYMPNGYYMLPASAWWNKKRQRLDPVSRKIPSGLKLAVDCGGFTAARVYGDYQYTTTQYIEWIHGFPYAPQWAAIQDYCCEPELEHITRERQDKTTAFCETFWQYRDCEWVWIPTIQGYELKEYIRHTLEIKPLIEKWQAFYEERGQGDIFRVGIGTLCARPYTADIQAIVMAIADILPGINFHLWGVKLRVLQSSIQLPRIVSVDSAAWDSGLHRTGVAMKKERLAMGLSQAEHALTVALPDYLNKVLAAVDAPKQMTLFA